jgi:hypothetical protein
MTLDLTPLANLLADILAEQRQTTDAVVKLTAAIAGVKDTAQKYREQKAIEVEPALTAPEAAQVAKAVIEKASVITYAMTAKAITDVMKQKDRATALAVLEKFGVSNLKDIVPGAKPDTTDPKFADILAAAEAALA